MTLDEVRACLEKDGWPVDVVSEVTLRSRFRAGDRVFPLFVHLESVTMGETPSSPWGLRPPTPAPAQPGDLADSPQRHLTYATFAVIPFAKLPDEDGGDLLVDRLLVLNREMNLAKFSVDEDGDVILSVEYPLADLDPSEVRDAVDVLSFYAEKYRAEIQDAAAAAV
jgi:hypothetical protein